MKFFDQFVNRPPADEEINSGEEIVEKAGYIPAEIQIMEMINAGERLGEFRKEKYDYESLDDDDGMMDPTRRKDFDLAEASQIGGMVNERIDESKKRYNEKIEEEKKEKEEKEKGEKDGNN